MASLGHWLGTVLLLSLRIVPTIVFSPPFTLVRLPATVRLILCLSLSAWLAAGNPAHTTAIDIERQGILVIAAGELAIGLALALPLQLAFAALMTVGRAIDLQAGYAFAMLVDPTLKTQVPLIGMIFGYGAAAIFFAAGAPADLLGIWSLSLQQAALGAGLESSALSVLTGYFGSSLVLAFGCGGLVLLVLFLIDGTIALMSRTLPQMNVLFLGFQVKAIATLILMPLALAGSAALFLSMFRFAFDTMLKAL